jgi:homocitrate synthase NifV
MVMDMNAQGIDLIDTTLRDGEQAPGLSFTMKEKRVIALNLIELGIDEIEAGIPAMGKETRDFISWLSREGSSCRVSSWARLLEKDIWDASKTGSHLIHISMPISDFHLSAQMGTWENAIQSLKGCLRLAESLFDKVSLGLQDSFRSSHQRLEEVCSIAEDHQLYRIRFSDTVGNSFPGTVHEYIAKYREKFSGKIDFHGHNDLGLASANSLCALEAGADSVNVTINGIGERAGNTSLEEMVFILDQHPCFKSTISLNKIKPLSQLVSRYTKRPIAVDKPIVGDLVFTHESGVHCHGLLSNPLAYQPFIPEEKGLASTVLVVGTHSGKSNVLSVLEKAGIHEPVGDISLLMNSYRKKAAIKKSYLTGEEVLEIYNAKSGKANETM